MVKSPLVRVAMIVLARIATSFLLSWSSNYRE